MNIYSLKQHPTIYNELQYTQNDRTPYTYLIGWSNYNVWYYGSRYGRRCHPSDLWVSYFTSSEYVKEFRERVGEPDVIQIRRVFDSISATTNFENTVLRRLKVTLAPQQWLNKRADSFKNLDTLHINYRFGTNNPMHGKSFIWINDGESIKQSLIVDPIPNGWVKGRLPTKLQIRGKKRKLEAKICPHCGLLGKGGNMSRYHFDNCRQK